MQYSIFKLGTKLRVIKGRNKYAQNNIDQSQHSINFLNKNTNPIYFPNKYYKWQFNNFIKYLLNDKLKQMFSAATKYHSGKVSILLLVLKVQCPFITDV